MQISSGMFAHIETAYRTMRTTFRYAAAHRHPEQDPTDTELAEEIANYAEGWFPEEQAMKFFVGCPNYGDRETLVYIIEAARCVTGMRPDIARRLLLHAAQRLAPNEPTILDIE